MCSSSVACLSCRLSVVRHGAGQTLVNAPLAVAVKVKRMEKAEADAKVAKDPFMKLLQDCNRQMANVRLRRLSIKVRVRFRT